MEELVEDTVYIPEREPYSLNLKQAGYDTNLVLVNGQNFIFNYMLHIILSLLPFTVAYLLCNKGNCCALRKNQLHSYLLLNGTIRLLLESYLEMSVFSLINISEIEWPPKLDSVTASNYLSICFISVHCLLILALPLSYCCCRGIWIREEFKTKLLALLESTNHREPDTLRNALSIPMLFLARRMTFGLTLIFLQNLFWGQIAAQFFYATLALIFILWSRPLESSFTIKVEVFNEVVTIMLCYLLMLFTDFVPLSETRYTIGFGYIGIVCFMALVHLLLIVCPILKLLYSRCKYCCIRRQKRKEQRILIQSLKSMSASQRIKIYQMRQSGDTDY